MHMNTPGQDFWDLDLRIEPARQQQGKIGLSVTTETVTKILSRLPTGCGYQPSDACPAPRMGAYRAQR